MIDSSRKLLFDVALLLFVATCSLLSGVVIGSHIVPRGYVFETPVTPVTSAPATEYKP